MALGAFDRTAVPEGWWDETAQAEGWFDADLLDSAASVGAAAGLTSLASQGQVRGLTQRSFTFAGAALLGAAVVAAPPISGRAIAAPQEAPQAQSWVRGGGLITPAAPAARPPLAALLVRPQTKANLPAWTFGGAQFPGVIEQVVGRFVIEREHFALRQATLKQGPPPPDGAPPLVPDDTPGTTSLGSQGQRRAPTQAVLRFAMPQDVAPAATELEVVRRALIPPQPVASLPAWTWRGQVPADAPLPDAQLEIRRQVLAGPQEFAHPRAWSWRGVVPADAAVRPTVAHNGGKLQINISAGAIPFLNVAKMMHPWTNVSGNVWADPSELTAKGYPKSAGAKVWYTSVDVARQSARPGNYVIKWTGTATWGWQINTSTLVSAGPGVTVSGTGSAQTYAGTNGRIVITPAVATGTGGVEVGRITLRLISTSDLTDLVICHEDDEDDLAAGKYFQRIGLDVLRAGKFGWIRSMDSFWTNVSNVSRWEYRKPLDYFSWREHEFREELWAGTTTNSGDAFSATLAGYALEPGRLTLLRWNVAPSSGVGFTLNISGTGAKPVVTRTGAVVSGGLMPVANGMSSVVYDADMDWYVLAEGNSTNTYWGIQNGWPPEVYVALCNEVGAHPWVTMPYLCEHDPSDYMGGWANLFKTSLGSGLVPVLQNVNEMWNTGSSWPGTLYFDAKAKAIYGPSYNYLDWYSRSLSLMGQAVSAVFGGDRTKYWTVVGQHTNDGAGETAAARRLESTAYVALEGGSPAKNWITHAAITNYWAAWFHNTKGSTEELVYSWEWKDATPARKAELVDRYVSENQTVNTNGPYGQVTVARVKDIIALWVSRYGAYGVPVIHYEGGYSPDFAATNARSSIVGIAKGAQTVITLNASDNQAVPVVGMDCLIEAGSVGGMTELNGNTYTVTAINVAARQFTIDVDSTSFGTYTSGGVAQYLNTLTPLNAFRRASKYSNHVRTLTLQNYADIEEVGALMPSEFTLIGADAWGIADPDLYADPYTARWDAILEFGTPATETAEQFSGGYYWPDYKKKRRFEIEEVPEAVEAVQEAVAIERKPARTKTQIRAKEKALRKAEAEFREALRAEYADILAEEMKALWREEIARQVRRRKAAALLLLAA